MIVEKDDIESSKTIYRKYQAVKQYFHGNFDYWKYNGLASYKICNGLESKQDFYRCLGLYRKYHNLNDIEHLLVLNVWNDKTAWIGAINHDLFKDYKKWNESQNYFFNQEIKNTIFVDNKYNERFNSSESYKHSEIFYFYKTRKLSIFSLCLINIITKFLDKIFIKHNDFVFEDDYKQIKKLQSFIEVWKDFDIKSGTIVLKKCADEAKEF